MATVGPAQSWMASLGASFKNQIATWMVALAITLLGLFSDRITESMKFALNRADMRTKQYESVCTDLSSYIFRTELLHEFVSKGWTTQQSLSPLVTDYNTSITSLRNNEYVYLAWIYRYWDSKRAQDFTEMMKIIKEIDAAIHELNDEFESVNITKSKAKADPAKTKPVTDRIAPLLLDLQGKTRAFLESLR